MDLKRLGLQEGEVALDGIRLSDEEVATLRKRAAGLVLTDDYAPVDNLLTPVIRDRTND